MKTPILLITFNRPEHTRRVLKSVCAQQPEHLYVFQDGARNGNTSDIEKCAAVRNVITELVDWPCQLHSLYSEKNLGCGPGPAAAITWFFEDVEQGIILEDDCVPIQSFFRYCQEMLDLYKDNHKIGIISGFLPLGKWKSKKQSYHFSNDGTTWGWATWRNRWAKFDFEAKSWPSKEGKLFIRKHFCNNLKYKTWCSYFDEYCTVARRDVWDYQWSYARFCNGFLAVMPSVNQIQNIGFGEDSTHTFGENSELAQRKAYEMMFPLKYQKMIKRDRAYDFLAFNKFVTRVKNTVFRRLIDKILLLLYAK